MLDRLGGAVECIGLVYEYIIAGYEKLGFMKQAKCYFALLVRFGIPLSEEWVFSQKEAETYYHRLVKKYRLK